MSKKEFDTFLEKEEAQKKSPIDWNAEKDWWLNKIETLYTDVQNWLKEYTDSNKVNIEINDINIFEEPLGVYSAKQMKIKINDKIATLTPIGTILIGTKGRVDLNGDEGTIRFILADRKSSGPKVEIKIYLSDEEKMQYEEEEKKKIKPIIDWVWKITTNPPKIKYTELNQDTFLKALIEVYNG